jgi:hypothetical protein
MPESQDSEAHQNIEEAGDEYEPLQDAFRGFSDSKRPHPQCIMGARGTSQTGVCTLLKAKGRNAMAPDVDQSESGSWQPE